MGFFIGVSITSTTGPLKEKLMAVFVPKKNNIREDGGGGVGVNTAQVQKILSIFLKYKLKINKTNNLTTVSENAAPHKNMLTGAGKGAI